MKKKEKWIKKRHSFFFVIIKFLLMIYFKLFYNLKYDRFKIKKGEKYIVISNHQTTMDPFILNMSFNKLLYFVASDDLMNIKYASWWIRFIVAIIPKSKGQSDYKTVKCMMQVLKENGSIGLFPEGNRTYTGELCYISPTIIKFAKTSKTPLLIYNIEGGYGVDPRWGNTLRKGKIHAFVKRIITIDEMNSLTDDELYQLVLNELDTHELESNKIYNSNKAAERIERILFLCPECGKHSCLHSNGNDFYCDACKSTFTYTSNLKIKQNDKDYIYPNVARWNDYQINWIKNYNINQEGIIFNDNDIEIYLAPNKEKQRLIATGSLFLNNQELFLNSLKPISFNIDSMSGVAILHKCKIIFRVGENTYIIKTNKKIRDDFNPAKYVFMINHIHNIRMGGNDEFLGI